MPNKSSTPNRALLLRSVLSVVVVIAASVVLAAHWSTVKQGLELARQADPTWFAWALLLMVFSFSIAAALYGILALRPLRHWQTVQVEVASAFVNRLLPSGLGGLGLHWLYLYKREHTVAEATVVVSVNNLIGIVAHLLLLIGVVVLRPQVLAELYDGRGLVVSWRLVIPLLAVAMLLVLIPPIRRKVSVFSRNLAKGIRQLELAQIVLALPLAMMLTTTYTMILFASAHAIGVNISALQLFVIFSVGMLLGTATPTPGGLVGAEAGLFAGFVAYSVSVPKAAAVIVLFRLVTYWLPLLPGATALFFARQSKLV